MSRCLLCALFIWLKSRTETVWAKGERGLAGEGWKEGAREEYGGWMRSKFRMDLNENVLMKTITVYSEPIPILNIRVSLLQEITESGTSVFSQPSCIFVIFCYCVGI